MEHTRTPPTAQPHQHPAQQCQHDHCSQGAHHVAQGKTQPSKDRPGQVQLILPHQQPNPYNRKRGNVLVGQHGCQEIGRRVQGIHQRDGHSAGLGKEPSGDAIHQAARSSHPQSVAHLERQQAFTENPDHQRFIGDETCLVSPVVEVVGFQVLPAALGNLASGVVHGLEILHRLGAENQDDPQGDKKPQGEQRHRERLMRSQKPQPSNGHSPRDTQAKKGQQYVGSAFAGCHSRLHNHDQGEQGSKAEAEFLTQPAHFFPHRPSLPFSLLQNGPKASNPGRFRNRANTVPTTRTNPKTITIHFRFHRGRFPQT